MGGLLPLARVRQVRIELGQANVEFLEMRQCVGAAR